MKSLTEHLWLKVPNRRGFINITPKIEELVRQSGVTEGLCLVNAMHITASVLRLSAFRYPKSDIRNGSAVPSIDRGLSL